MKVTVTMEALQPLQRYCRRCLRGLAAAQTAKSFSIRGFFFASLQSCANSLRRCASARPALTNKHNEVAGEGGGSHLWGDSLHGLSGDLRGGGLS